MCSLKPAALVRRDWSVSKFANSCLYIKDGDVILAYSGQEES